MKGYGDEAKICGASIISSTRLEKAGEDFQSHDGTRPGIVKNVFLSHYASVGNTIRAT